MKVGQNRKNTKATLLALDTATPPYSDGGVRPSSTFVCVLVCANWYHGQHSRQSLYAQNYLPCTHTQALLYIFVSAIQHGTAAWHGAYVGLCNQRRTHIVCICTLFLQPRRHGAGIATQLDTYLMAVADQMAPRCKTYGRPSAASRSSSG